MEEGGGKKSIGKKKEYAVFALWGIIIVYGLLCLYLFYMQSIQPLDGNNRYFQSDLPYHISMIVDDGWYYSFTAYAWQLLYWLGGKSTVLIAAFLAAVAVFTVLLTEKLLRMLLKRKAADALFTGATRDSTVM